MVALPLSGSKIADCHMGWDFIQQVVAQRGKKAPCGDSGVVPAGLFPGRSGACCMFSDMKPDDTGVLALLQSTLHSCPAMGRRAKRGFCSEGKEPALGKGSSS